MDQGRAETLLASLLVRLIAEKTSIKTIENNVYVDLSRLSEVLSDSIGSVQASLGVNLSSLDAVDVRLSSVTPHGSRISSVDSAYFINPNQRVALRKRTTNFDEAVAEFTERLKPELQEIANSTGKSLEAVAAAAFARLSGRVKTPKAEPPALVLPGRQPKPYMGKPLSGDPVTFLDKEWGRHIKAGRVALQQLSGRDKKLVQAIYDHCRDLGISPTTVLPSSWKKTKEMSAEERLELSRARSREGMKALRQRRHGQS